MKLLIRSDSKEWHLIFLNGKAAYSFATVSKEKFSFREVQRRAREIRKLIR